MTATPPDDVDELPPSAKFVVYVLNNADGSITREELLARTELPERTVDDTLSRLEVQGIIRRDRESDDLRFVRIEFTDAIDLPHEQ